jgi:hypothetical protein
VQRLLFFQVCCSVLLVVFLFGRPEYPRGRPSCPSHAGRPPSQTLEWQCGGSPRGRCAPNVAVFCLALVKQSSRAKCFLATSFLLNFSPTGRHTSWRVEVATGRSGSWNMQPEAAADKSA